MRPILTEDKQKKLWHEIKSHIDGIEDIEDNQRNALLSRINNDVFYPTLKDCIRDIIQDTQILIFDDEEELNDFVKRVYENRNISTHQGSLKKIEREKLAYIAKALSIIVRTKILNEITENKYSEKFKDLQSHVIEDMKNKTY